MASEYDNTDGNSFFSKYPHRMLTGAEHEREIEFWIKRMDLFLASSRLSEKEFLLIIVDYLSDDARDWWDTIGYTATTWKEFKKLLEDEYLFDMENTYLEDRYLRFKYGSWFRELSQLKQGVDYPTVSSLVQRLQIIFQFANVVDETDKKHFLISSVYPEIAMQLCINGVQPDASFQEVKKQALRVEKLLISYGKIATPAKTSNSTSSSGVPLHGALSATTLFGPDDMDSLAEKLRLFEINMNKKLDSLEVILSQINRNSAIIARNSGGSVSHNQRKKTHKK